jgi:hypothetical protein
MSFIPLPDSMVKEIHHILRIILKTRFLENQYSFGANWTRSQLEYGSDSKRYRSLGRESSLLCKTKLTLISFANISL